MVTIDPATRFSLFKIVTKSLEPAQAISSKKTAGIIDYTVGRRPIGL
jgi:hypothetical protein